MIFVNAYSKGHTLFLGETANRLSAGPLCLTARSRDAMAEPVTLLRVAMSKVQACSILPHE